jgi:predicted dehydrogenase
MSVRRPRGLRRREFLSAAGSLLAGCATAPAVLTQGAPQDKVRFAIVGLNQRGNELRRALELVERAQVSVLCDVDQRILARELDDPRFTRGKPAVETDLRRVLERSDVDAVIVATPNHWHALAGIWALQAGKHVYVEKPVSHSLWEGEQLAHAALRYGKIAQAGTQNRSDEGLRGFREWRATQDLGAVRWAHAVWYRLRAPIGKVAGPQPIAPEIDHDLFCGPREVGPVLRREYHYDWHWQWPFGNGEIGNLGAHPLDDLRALTGVGLPKRVLCAGARVLWDDDGQTPNVSLSVFDYGAFSAVLELRNLPLAPGLDVSPSLRGLGSGLVVRFERGCLMAQRAETRFYDERGQLVQSWRGDAGRNHLRNFTRAIFKNDPALRAAPLEDVVTSSATCHLANNAWRAGREATLEELREQLWGVDPALAALDSLPQHLAAHGIAPGKLRLRAGGWLDVAPERARFVSGDNFEAANLFAKEEYRAPFAVPQLG